MSDPEFQNSAQSRARALIFPSPFGQSKGEKGRNPLLGIDLYGGKNRINEASAKARYGAKSRADRGQTMKKPIARGLRE